MLDEITFRWTAQMATPLAGQTLLSFAAREVARVRMPAASVLTSIARQPKFPLVSILARV